MNLKMCFLTAFSAAALLLCTIATSAKDVYVHGYTRANGTYVQPYHRSSPNDTKLDNYSTIGNVNPYTGQPGTVDPYATPTYAPAYEPPQQPEYQQPQDNDQPPADDDDGSGSGSR